MAPFFDPESSPALDALPLQGGGISARAAWTAARRFLGEMSSLAVANAERHAASELGRVSAPTAAVVSARERGGDVESKNTRRQKHDSRNRAEDWSRGFCRFEQGQAGRGGIVLDIASTGLVTGRRTTPI